MREKRRGLLLSTHVTNTTESIRDWRLPIDRYDVRCIRQAGTLHGRDVAASLVPLLIGNLVAMLVDHHIAVDLTCLAIGTCDVLLALMLLVLVVSEPSRSSCYGSDKQLLAQSSIAFFAIGIELLWNISVGLRHGAS
jgi:hypothetical protein